MAEYDYVLGHDDSEMHRLDLRGRLFASGVERVLRKAGLEAGMRVLDVGTGAGDIALLAAQIVGPSGAVLGIDPSTKALAHAGDRAEAAALEQVQFQAVSLDELQVDNRFDFVVAARVIGHVPDPINFLREAAAHVTPGGVLVQCDVALPQPDLPQLKTGYQWSSPPVSLFDEVADMCMAAFALGGSRAYDGAQMVRLFHDAGLPEPLLSWEEQVCGPEGSIVEILCLTFHTLLPALKNYGVTAAGEIDPETLYRKMRAAVAEAHSQVRFDNLVSAWATIS